MLKRYAIILILLPVLTTLATVQAQGFTLSTDRSIYDYGDAVRIYIQPAPAIGVDYWLIVTKPDGSQNKLDVSPGTGDVTTSAGPPAGQYTVELWGQVVAPDSTPQVYASCSYEVRGPATPQFTISTDQSVYYYGDTVRIFIQPAPAIGVDYWLVITKPDGSQERIDLSAGQGTATTVADPPPGQYAVDLWGQVVSLGSGSQVYASCSYEVRHTTPPQQFTISTDQTAYEYGDTVRIYIQPAPAIGVNYWLIITRPDGSQNKIDLSTGQGAVSLVAGPPPGRWRVELWGQPVSPGSGSQVYATCDFQVRQPVAPQQFTISTDQSVYNYGDTVTIHIRPAPAIGVGYWLIITKPDGSQTRIDLSTNQGAVTSVAAAPAGRYRVELWGQVVAPNTTPQLYAQNSYEVRQQVTTVTGPTTVTTVTQPTTVTTVVTSKGGGQCYLRDGAGNCILGCVIATAAYGSEMTPEVAYMRYVRDSLIGSTPTGKALVAAFNAFYYSWSPAVANAIARSEPLRAFFRVILLPLVAIVHVAALMFTAIANATGGRDLASFVAFLASAIMTIVVYIILPALTGAKLIQAARRRRV